MCAHIYPYVCVYITLNAIPTIFRTIWSTDLTKRVSKHISPKLNPYESRIRTNLFINIHF